MILWKSECCSRERKRRLLFSLIITASVFLFSCIGVGVFLFSSCVCFLFYLEEFVGTLVPNVRKSLEEWKDGLNTRQVLILIAVCQRCCAKGR